MAAALLRASLSGAVAVVIVWLTCRLMPRLSPATRATLWWCVAAKFVITLVWMAPLRVPVLPAPPRPMQVTNGARLPVRGAWTEQHNVYVFANGRGARTPSVIQMIHAPLVGTPVAAGASRWWPIAIVAIWIAGVIIAVGVGARHWRRTRALVDRSLDAPEPIQSLTRSLASRLSLVCVPAVKMSDDIETPLVVGLRRAVVLLPAQIFARMSERQQEMSICHELAHVKRADLRFGCLPALAEALFFFHPFAKFATREYALWREAACDAAVLAALDAAPNEYGRLLLDLGVAAPRGGALAATAASRSPTQLKRRLVLLSDAAVSSRASRILTAVAIGVALLALVPIQLVARTSAPFPLRRTMAAITSQNPPPLPPPPARKVVPREPTPPEYLLFHDDDTVTVGTTSDVVVTAHGGMFDVVHIARGSFATLPTNSLGAAIAHARQFKKPGQKLFWFLRGGREYVVRDPATLRQLETMWKPFRATVVTPDQPSMLDSFSLVRSDGSLTNADRVSARHDLEMRMQTLTKAMAQLSAQLDKNPATAKEIDGQMTEMGLQMEMLGHDLQQAARGEFNLQSLLDSAIAKGLATAVR